MVAQRQRRACHLLLGRASQRSAHWISLVPAEIWIYTSPRATCPSERAGVEGTRPGRRDLLFLSHASRVSNSKWEEREGREWKGSLGSASAGSSPRKGNEPWESPVTVLGSSHRCPQLTLLYPRSCKVIRRYKGFPLLLQVSPISPLGKFSRRDEQVTKPGPWVAPAPYILKSKCGHQSLWALGSL